MVRCKMCHDVYADDTADHDGFCGDICQRAAECARLRAVNAELLAALRDIFVEVLQEAIPNRDDEWWDRAKAAIAKASEVTP